MEGLVSATKFEGLVSATFLLVPSYGRIQEALRKSCLGVAENHKQGFLVMCLRPRV